MAIIKCKMCGGDLTLTEGQSVAECEYCGSRQTVPTADDEKKLIQFERAERLRRNCEFDKAAGLYEAIVSEFRQEAEAYWGLVLCKYGIEYVDDPATGKKIPTCHRSSFDSVLKDSNFDLVMECSDAASRKIYREEAKAIEALRNGILEVSGKESPYDIFICYKETGADGGRTVDSVMAQEMYDALTEKGYKVFFSRITLEDKIGQQYEPYIFAALNSARIMLAVGTEYDHYHAVWVKNEWSRYLSLIAKGEKKILIPCYKDIDLYDMPEAFSKLQGQDMGKIGAMQDLLRGIDKLMGKDTAQQAQSQTLIQATGMATADSLIKRARLYLEEENWSKVLEYCEKILDAAPESAETYWIQELAQCECVNEEALAQYYYSYGIQESRAIGYARRFAGDNMKQVLNRFDTALNNLRWKDNQTSGNENTASHKLRQDIAKAREKFKLIEKRVANRYPNILAINEAGRIVSTKELNLYGRVDRSWEKRFQELEQLPVLRSIYCTAFDSRSMIMFLDFQGNVHVLEPKYIDEEYKAAYKKFVKTVSRWSGIKELHEDGTYVTGIYGLKEDGNIEYVSWEEDTTYGRPKVKVSNLQQIDAILNDSVCRKKDGSLANMKYMGKRGKANFSYKGLLDWKDIQSLWYISNRMIGLQKDGTLVATSFDGNDKKWDKWEEISKWTNVVDIFYGGNDRRICALDAYGNLLATSPLPVDKNADYTYDPWEKMSGWKDLVSVSIAVDYAIGLRFDGTVVFCDWFEENSFDGVSSDRGQCDVSGWKDVVYLNTNNLVTIAVKRDGTLLACGDNKMGSCNVEGMKLFSDIDNLEEIIQHAIKKAEEAEKRRQEQLALERKKAAYEAYKQEQSQKIQAEITEKSEPVQSRYAEQEASIRKEMEQKTTERIQMRDALSKQLAEKEQQKAKLGFFKRKEKESINNEIEAIRRQLGSLISEQELCAPYEAELAALQKTKDMELQRISQTVFDNTAMISFDEFGVS